MCFFDQKSVPQYYLLHESKNSIFALPCILPPSMVPGTYQVFDKYYVEQMNTYEC